MSIQLLTWSCLKRVKTNKFRVESIEASARVFNPLSAFEPYIMWLPSSECLIALWTTFMRVQSLTKGRYSKVYGSEADDFWRQHLYCFHYRRVFIESLIRWKENDREMLILGLFTLCCQNDVWKSLTISRLFKTIKWRQFKISQKFKYHFYTIKYFIIFAREFGCIGRESLIQ